MEVLICVAFWVLVIAGAMVRGRWKPQVAMETLCLTCVNSVVTRGQSGKAMIACRLGGVMRPVKFTVCQCTGFCGSAVPVKLVKIEGFVREEREVYAEVEIP